MSTERCELTDLLVDECAHCRRSSSVEDQVATEHAALLRRFGWFPAAHPGRCSACDARFGPDTPIRRDPHRIGWIAACCAEEAS